MGSQNQPKPRRENTFHSLLLNIFIPVLVLTQGDRLITHPGLVLVIALAFPIAYFAYDYRRRGKANFISILGFISILLTGGVGLLQLPRFWFIVKETAIPALIGLAVLASLGTRKPLIRLLVYSPEVFDVEALQESLKTKGTTAKMERLLKQTTALLAVSFFLSAVLNFILASHFVKTEPSVDPAQFNAEVGAMTGWSYVVITVPSFIIMAVILVLIVKGIRRYTGKSFEEALAPHLREENKGS
jgi:large-conductance mechanosensitive channel